MNILPFEIELIVHKYLHQSKLTNVNKEYKIRLGSKWNDDRNCFRGYNVRYQVYFDKAMYRQFNQKEGYWIINQQGFTQKCRLIYNLHTAIHTTSLPKNY